ncbi:unnamed protein product [Caenorhabditis auriculariae]|uniref:Trafficking protein particle complex subunit n=1 Tax=Caenorhabditis auriculariae TaxID=2777116 RepID=A0A8S1GYP2_9PELO|nr:unnamed protein product [Caenorhabditis auriculariae]
MSKNAKQNLADSKKMSAELFCLTYGSLVTELLRDYEDPKEVTMQLDKMGFNMGTRLADDFLAKNSNVPRCTDCRQIAEVLCKNAIPCYLGTTANSSNWVGGDREFTIVIENNPLNELVQVPPNLLAAGLSYSQVIAGAIRGALEAVHFKVYATAMENGANTEIRIRFDSVLKDNLPAGEDD